ncbi:Flp pilus assembly protein CpaB [Pontivivens nitratireducens]|uniref:Flp pilus assembly protein CpaB n=1 Tax=Pontivivens nitratireducens TaxID=2758038 RepID=A0A6G7VJL1_9RHOB|nr:Flp pilus assembly protein CpaB [Pontibrevibacter nitratireducens]QIK40056.1 Flp pilus assembly protein CpaB [Pontibrevibacter nitratireducens]
MRFLFLLFLIVGLGLAGFAAYTAKNRFDAYEVRLARTLELEAQKDSYVTVAVARRALSYGSELTPERVLFVNFPTRVVDIVGENWFLTEDDLFGEDAPNPSLLRNMEMGEPISRAKITGFGREAGVAARLGEGFRAFTIRVDVASGVSGFLTPSDRVDVFWSGRFRGEAVTRLIIENIDLIAVDQISDQDRNRPVVARTITVRATPQQAAVLAQAQASGALSLSLRGIGDVAETGDLEVNLDDVVGYVAPEPVIAEEIVPEVIAPRRTITIRRGSDVSIVNAD